MNDRWLYLKLFHDDPAVADTVLTHFVAPTSQTLLADESVDRLFFLRYFEGGHHIRYRLRVTDTARLDTLHRWLLVRACALEAIVRVERAAYEPEVQKHGGLAGLEIAERQFCASSRLALSCIEATAADPQGRARFGLAAIDVLLRHAGLDRAARRRCCLDYASHWGDMLERGVDPWEPAAPNPARIGLARACLERADSGLELGESEAAAAEWLASVRDDMAALRGLDAQGRLEVPMQVVLWNLIHTFNNRLGLGIASEVAIATLAGIVHALPTRPALPLAIDTDRPERIWAELVDGLSSGRPTAVAIDEHAAPVLAEWRAAAETIGASWVETPRAEPDELRPFALWRRLAQALTRDGAERLDHRLAEARRPWLDPECPMLPDPHGVYDVLADLLGPSIRPMIVVLRDVATASADCLAALSSGVLRRRRGAVVLVLVADAAGSDRDGAPLRRWASLVLRLREQARIHQLRLTGSSAVPRTPTLTSAASQARAGLKMCRAGALSSGVQLVATAISQDAGHGDDPELLVHLAMATLQLGELDLAAQAAEAAYQVGPSAYRDRARRVWMATMHANNDAQGLERLRAQVEHDLDQADRAGSQRAWLLLDAALCTALDVERRREHVAYLDAIVTGTLSEVPPQCLATAHIWRAAPSFTAGQLAEALPHQMAGVELLETLSDPTRLMFTRLRLGGTLWQLGRFEKAAELFELVVAVSLRQGAFETALDAAARAVLAHVEAERPGAAANLLHSAEPTVRHMWSRGPSVTLVCELALMLALGEEANARAIVEVFPPPDWARTLVEIPPRTAKSMAALHARYSD